MNWNVIAPFFLFLGFVIFGLVQVYLNRHKDQMIRKLAKADRQRQKLLDRQKNLSGRISNALSKACRESPYDNMEVCRFQSVLGDSIDVYLRDRCVLHIHINLLAPTAEQVSIRWGNKGSRENNTFYQMAADDFEGGEKISHLANMLIDWVPSKLIS